MNRAAVIVASEGKIGCDLSEGAKEENGYDISAQSMEGGGLARETPQGTI